MNKKALIRLGIIALAIIIIILLIPKKETSSHGNRYEVETTQVNQMADAKVSEVYLLMDPSGSIKGYFDFKEFPEARQYFVNNVSKPLDRLIADDDAKLLVKFGTNSNYKQMNVSDLQKDLKGGNFAGATTPLEAMIGDAIKQVTDTSVSILVSDMVLSYGLKKLKDEKDPWYNLHNLSGLGANIHTVFKNAKDVHVLVLQYYSDFNGNKYWNCTENQVNKEQYKNQLMKNRPYYLMVFGKRNVLENLLAKEVFPKEDNLYASFGLDSDNMKKSDLTIVTDKESAWIWDNETEDPGKENMGTLWTSQDMGGDKETFIVEFDKFDIPAFVNQNYTIDYSYSNVIEEVKEVTDSSKPNKLRFAVTLKPFNQLPDNGELEFRLLSSNSDWVKEATVEVDTLSVLDKKTWGFSTIIENIDAAFFGNQGRKPDTVARVKFNISKN